MTVLVCRVWYGYGRNLATPLFLAAWPVLGCLHDARVADGLDHCFRSPASPYRGRPALQEETSTGHMSSDDGFFSGWHRIPVDVRAAGSHDWLRKCVARGRTEDSVCTNCSLSCVQLTMKEALATSLLCPSPRASIARLRVANVLSAHSSIFEAF